MSLPWQREPFAPHEPERYELDEPARWHFLHDRREFLARLGGGIAVWCGASTLAAPLRGALEVQDRDELASAFVHVGEDGAVTVFTGKVEVGQDARTSLTQAVADELGVAPAAIGLVMGDTARVPFDQGTFGSRTTPAMAPQLRRAAAAARAMLVDLAAERLGVAATALTVFDGKVVDVASGRALGFGELARGQALARRVGSAALREDGVRVCGTSLEKVGARAIVTGAHRYPSDVVRPRMLHGRVLRPPVFGAVLEALDARAAEAMHGVRVVHDGEFAGVVAPDARRAELALGALVAKWRLPPAQADESELQQRLRAGEARGEPDARGVERRGGRRGRGDDERGDVEAALARAVHRARATYFAPYIAHAPLEPRAAVAEWDDGELIVWTGTQRPFGVQGELQRAFGLGPDAVRVIVPDTGSGYGGKHTGDAAVEAARLARSAGAPVAVRWTREEEFTWAYFRPAGVIDVEAGIDAEGRLVAWQFDNFNSGAAAIAPPYHVADRRVRFHQADSPLRQGSYRALAATFNHFARESHLDDLAALAGIDPIELRRRNLAEARIRAVLDAAVARATEDGAPAAGVGRGAACGTDKGGHVATVADVAVDAARKTFRVLRLVTAFECGAIVNPAGLRAQVEGCVVQGLGGALFEAVRFGQGRIHNPSFGSYRVPRFLDVPELVTLLLDRPDLPSAGAGECPIVCVAPAIRNAIAQACGQRLRELPLRLG